MLKFGGNVVFDGNADGKLHIYNCKCGEIVFTTIHVSSPYCWNCGSDDGCSYVKSVQMPEVVNA